METDKTLITPQRPSPAGRKFLIAAGMMLLVMNRALIAARLRRPRDGWRRGAGLVLRGEAATFVLSAFALDVWSDVGPSLIEEDIATTQKHLSNRLANFLAEWPQLHIGVRRSPRTGLWRPNAESGLFVGV